MNRRAVRAVLAIAWAAVVVVGVAAVVVRTPLPMPPSDLRTEIVDRCGRVVVDGGYPVVVELPSAPPPRASTAPGGDGAMPGPAGEVEVVADAVPADLRASVPPC